VSSTPSHTTVVAYVALFVALSTGGAYAVDRISSDDVQDNSLRSRDLKNRKAVTGKDVKRNALGGPQVRESSLNASLFAPIAGVGDAGDCDPTSVTPVTCVSTDLTLSDPSRVLVVATGAQYTAGASGSVGSAAGCDIRVDGAPRPAFATPGETTGSTSSGFTNGFARTFVTPTPLPAGSHEVALACWELDPDVRIETPTIAAIAISKG
jgi:hypothetical protein